MHMISMSSSKLGVEVGDYNLYEDDLDQVLVSKECNFISLHQKIKIVNNILPNFFATPGRLLDYLC